MSNRRSFLTQLSAVAATSMAIDADELKAATRSGTGEWDTSWLQRLAAAEYRVVFNASEINDGAVMDYAAAFLDGFHEAHGTTDANTRPVIVFRRLGTTMAFNDVVWDRYALAEDEKLNDPMTHAAARRNIFWKAKPGAVPAVAATTLEALTTRGLISLVCNVATNNIGYGLAQKRHLDVETVRSDLRANLIPGAILVPSGIYALIRAQNAGCAYMPGT